jgi:hypothetical protein
MAVHIPGLFRRAIPEKKGVALGFGVVSGRARPWRAKISGCAGDDPQGLEKVDFPQGALRRMWIFLWQI